MLKDIPGYEGHYRITENGAIYSLRSKKWLSAATKTRTSRSGAKGKEIKVISLSTCPSDRKSHYISRLIALTFVPNPNNYTQVNHIDGNPCNNHCSNIEWCTQSQNIKHAYDNKLMTPRRGLRGNNKSGEPNIRQTSNGKWLVQVWHKSKPYNCGTFVTIKEAIKARDNFIANLSFNQINKWEIK